MNATVPNSNPTARRVVLLFSLLLIAIVVIAGYLHRKAMGNAPRGYLPPVWDGVPAALAAARKSPEYTDGGYLLSHPGDLASASEQQNFDYACRIVVDFFYSLTPGQIAVLHNRHWLRFSELNAGQQKALVRLGEFVGNMRTQRQVMHDTKPLLDHVDRSVVCVWDIHTGWEAADVPPFAFKWMAAFGGGELTSIDITFPPKKPTALIPHGTSGSVGISMFRPSKFDWHVYGLDP